MDVETSKRRLNGFADMLEAIPMDVLAGDTEKLLAWYFGITENEALEIMNLTDIDADDVQERKKRAADYVRTFAAGRG